MKIKLRISILAFLDMPICLEPTMLNTEFAKVFGPVSYVGADVETPIPYYLFTIGVDDTDADIHYLYMDKEYFIDKYRSMLLEKLGNSEYIDTILKYTDIIF